MSDIQTITEQAARDARDVFESYGSKAREAIDYMEQLIYAAMRKTEPAADAPPIPPLRYFFAEGDTIDQMRDHARAHPITREGDIKLVWANEGDIYNHSAPFFRKPAADARPVQDDAASRRRKIMGYMDDKAAADARAEALKADLLFDAYKGLLVLHRMLDKSGLDMGAKTAADMIGRIEAAHPEMPGRSALRALIGGAE